MVQAFIGLGANLGDVAASLWQALAAIDGLPLTRVSKTSSLYKTAPLDTDSTIERRADGGDYLNAVIAVDTELVAPLLLAHLQQIEHSAGRERAYRNAPRALDLDLLLYGDAQMQSSGLTLPHPRMMQRAFVLVPLAEIAPGRVSARQLQAVCHQAIERIGDWLV